jgi:hypothetical protein
MYTKGIRKIFNTRLVGATFTKISRQAVAAGYTALVFNGGVFITTKQERWIESCFHITDFSDEQ